MVKEELEQKIGEFERVLQKVASDMAGGVSSKKLSPSELLTRTEHNISRLKDLTTNSEELMLVLKPERTPTIKSLCKNLTQTLTTFKEILIQNTQDPLANSRLALEQLRKALTDGSDFLFLMREVRENPSPLIDAIMTFKKASETKGSVISIQAKEDVQPLIKYVLGRLDDFRVALMALEKKVDEMKQIMRELQEESLRILSSNVSLRTNVAENKMEKKQFSLSNFKTEEKKHVDG